MKQIGLISDTHGTLDEAIFKHFSNVDEIWHAGDFGSTDIARALRDFKPLRGVWGNIDCGELRVDYPEVIKFMIEGVKVVMMHIGGYPGRYSSKAKTELEETKPQLFISGHSHILKVMFDERLQCLHMNPGAAGMHGWHHMRTIIRFAIDGDKIKNCEVIELGKRSKVV